MSSSKMLAAVVPSVNGKWEVKEVSTPQPGTNQVLIKMHASGICYTDVHATNGALGVKFPYTIGDLLGFIFIYIHDYDESNFGCDCWDSYSYIFNNKHPR